MHNLPPLPLVGGALFVDNSMLELLTTCPRALEYNKLHKRIAASDKPSLAFGSAVHEAIEYRAAVYQADPPDPYLDEDQHAILAEFFESHIPPVDDWRNLDWAVQVMKRYNEVYRFEPFNLLKYDVPIDCPKCEGRGHTYMDIVPDGSEQQPCVWCKGTGKRDVMVELSFALPLFTWEGKLYRENGLIEPVSVPVMYQGRIDLPVHWDGALFVIDHKTTSLLGSTFFERMAMSAQQLGYCWAFEQLTGQKVNGYCINAVRTKEPPQYLSSGKGGQIEKWWSESFAREKYYVTPARLVEWKHNTIQLIEEFFYHYRKGYMPQKTAWCCQFGRCQYYDVCTLPAESRGVMLASGLYTENKWSPLKEPSAPKQ